MKIIDGKKIAEKILKDLQAKINKIGANKIGLAFIIVGKNIASKKYVAMKKRACAKVGILSFDIQLEEKISENELIYEIEKLNSNEKIDGILVQLPLPKHINQKNIIYKINPNKDVDGFHPINLGKMLLGYTDGFFPCTPLGIKTLLQKENINLEDKHTVILGRSNIVGKPLFAMLSQKQPGANATITLCHSKTKNLKEITKTADILITAIGKPKFVTKEMVKPKAVIIDVGINRIIENGKKKIVGDVDFESVFPIISKITPVPGGIGPMTIAILLKNTYKSYIQKLSSS